jgi:uncharacterized membrane protein YhaH (DUF805 family)
MNPLVWKALRQQSSGRKNRNIFWIWALAAVGATFAAMPVCGVGRAAVGWGIGLGTETAVDVTMNYVCFVSALAAASALGHERQRQTLESLFSLPLSDAEVHQGLLWPGLLQLWRELGYAFPWLLVWVCCDRSPALLAVICVCTLVLGWFCAQVGLWVSTLRVSPNSRTRL